MRTRWFAFGSLLLLAALVGCDGRGGSSGFDVTSENAAISQALDRQQCVDFRGLAICPVESEATPIPTATPASPTPVGSPTATITPGGTPSVATTLDGATAIDCVQNASGPCRFTLTFTTQAFAPATLFRVLFRTIAPDGPWVVGADPVPRGGSDATTFDTPLTLMSAQGGPPAHVQFAVLAFEVAPPPPAMEFQLLQQTNAEFAFVTEVFTLNVVASCLNGSGTRSGGCVVGSGDPSTCTEGALDAALAGGGLVIFDCGPNPITIPITHETDITTDTSIDGGTLITLNGGNEVQLFSVRGGVTMTLANLTVSHGMAPQGDGAIQNIGTLSATNCTFADNSALGGAAAIENIGDSATLTLTNCTFRDNVGGAMNSGSVIANNQGRLTVTNSTFSGNSGLCIDSSGPGTVTGSTFSGNVSQLGGVIESDGTMSVTNSTFSNNAADVGTGVISNGGVLTVSNSTFNGNIASNGDGGAIFSTATLIVMNCTFTGNVATQGSGGAIYGDGMVAITNSTFADNGAGTAGGALYSAGSTPPVIMVVTNSTFADNSAVTGDTVAVHRVGGSIVFRNSILASSGTSGNCSGSMTDGGHNLDSGSSCGFTSAMDSLNNTDPLLDPAGLADNGGPTQTIALQPGSLAIDAGDPARCAGPPVNGVDQRGFERSAAACSIGAYEYDVPDVCCQCTASCASPVHGSCGACVAVQNATCETGALCVLYTPMPTSTPTATALTPTPTRTAPFTPTKPTLTPTVTMTPTLGPADCCQCVNLCAAPVLGTCGGCTAVREASCIGSTCIPGAPAEALRLPPTSTPTATATIKPMG